ncbi:MAG: FecR domain-containing protein [Novosphingobium sp.]
MGGESEAIMGMHGSDKAEARSEQARAWMVRLASGAMSAEELEALDRWNAIDPRNRAAFLLERQTWQDLHAIEASFSSAQPLLSANSRRWPSLLLPAAVAAALAWFAVPAAWLWIQADVVSATGEIREIALEDGSRAVLDSDSAIAIDYRSGERTVRLLKGRAWFAVRHGDARPFRVAAADGVVRDVGTAFEVDDTALHTRVGVTEGVIELEALGGRLVHASERAEFADGGHVKVLPPLPVDQIGTWRRGELLLREVPLDAAIRAVARYRAAPVLMLGDFSGERPISAGFRTDRPDEALDTLAAMRGLERARLPGGILLLRPRAH